MADSSRHPVLAPSRPSTAPVGHHDQRCGRRPFAPPRHRLGTLADVPLAERCRRRTLSDGSGCGPVSLARLSPLDRGSLEPAAVAGVQAGTPATGDVLDSDWRDRARGALALHPLRPRRCMDVERRGRLECAHRQRLLRRPTDDESLGRRGVLRLPRRSPLTLRADAEGGTRLHRERPFVVVAARAVAGHVAAVSAIRMTDSEREPQAGPLDPECPVSSRAGVAVGPASRSDIPFTCQIDESAGLKEDRA